MTRTITLLLLAFALPSALPANYSTMRIESVKPDGNGITVTTTGATYVLSGRGIELIRRVDPKTNTINPRLVARISFASDLGELRIESQSPEGATVASAAATFRFNPDSLFFVDAKAPLTFTFANLIKDAPWNKNLPLDRMWTDGYGGSLHASVLGKPKPVSRTADDTTIALSAGDRMAFMVYPTRLYDFESLYGRNARPHVHFLTQDYMHTLTSEQGIEPYVRHGFGLFTLWKIYDYPGEDQSQPVLLADGDMGYRVRDPAALKRFVDFVHARGFKVVPYFVFHRNPKWRYPAGHPKAGQFPDIKLTLAWMRRFQKEHHFDGWYIDGAETGDFMTDYDFMREVRRDVGEKGIIYYHNSIDPWGYNVHREHRFAGLRAIFLDTYANYTLSGEMGDLATVHTPNDPYYRFYTGGYGFSQAYAAHKRKSFMDIAISEAENDRVIGENLNGTQRTREREWRPTWMNQFKPAFDRRRQEYLSGRFDPDVTVPIDPARGWFRTPLNLEVKPVGSTAVKITWQTPEPADHEVAYTSNGIWWPRLEAEAEPRPTKGGVKPVWPPPGLKTGPDGAVKDVSLTRQHSVTISDLNPKTEYKFRIKSSNRKRVPDEIIWQEIVAWKAGDGDDSKKKP